MAESLEASGLWRRASARWLDVMLEPKLTAAQRLWVRQRRLYCQKQILPATRSEKLNIGEIVKAANAVLKQIGYSSRKNNVTRNT